MKDYATCPACKTSVPLKASRSATDETVAEKVDRVENRVQRLSEELRKMREELREAVGTKRSTTDADIETAEVEEADFEEDDDGIYDPTEEWK
jgi:hypothetical protein